MTCWPRTPRKLGPDTCAGWGNTDLGARFAGFVSHPQHLSALLLWAAQVAWISSAQRENFTENSLQSGRGSQIPRRQQQGLWQESRLGGHPGWSRLPVACRPSGLGAVASIQPWASKVFLRPSVLNPWLNPVRLLYKRLRFWQHMQRLTLLATRCWRQPQRQIATKSACSSWTAIVDPHNLTS